MTQLSVTTHRRGGTVHLCVAGDVDLATSTTLGNAITTAVNTCTPADGVLVDLAAVTFLDCTGVTALLTGRLLAAARHVSYQVVNASGIALRVLQTLDLVALLNGATPTAADWSPA